MENGESVNGLKLRVSGGNEVFSCSNTENFSAVNTVIRIKFRSEGYINIPASAIQRTSCFAERPAGVPGRRMVILQAVQVS